MTGDENGDDRRDSESRYCFEVDHVFSVGSKPAHQACRSYDEQGTCCSQQGVNIHQVHQYGHGEYGASAADEAQ